LASDPKFRCCSREAWKLWASAWEASRKKQYYVDLAECIADEVGVLRSLSLLPLPPPSGDHAIVPTPAYSTYAQQILPPMSSAPAFMRLCGSKDAQLVKSDIGARPLHPAVFAEIALARRTPETSAIHRTMEKATLLFPRSVHGAAEWFNIVSRQMPVKDSGSIPSGMRLTSMIECIVLRSETILNKRHSLVFEMQNMSSSIWLVTCV
jgi:hypothetical protein